MDELVGRALGPYELLDRIGTGGMATVYRGVHRALGQPRAIKILLPTLAADESLVERFRSEAKIASGLRHPNIVSIYDVGEQDGLFYLVMDLVEGVSLGRLLRREQQLDLDRAVRLLVQLASALDYAHEQGILHRDIKASNVLVGDDDHVSLFDFGIARAAAALSRLTIPGQMVGTPEYMAPEVITGGEGDYRADFYALGILAYQMLAGRLPFVGDDPVTLLYAQVSKPPPPLREARPDLPEGVERVVLRQLAKEPEDRYPSAERFVSALSVAASGRAVPGPHAPADTRHDVPRGPRTSSPGLGDVARQTPPPSMRPGADEEIATPRDFARPPALDPSASTIPPEPFYRPGPARPPEPIRRPEPLHGGNAAAGWNGRDQPPSYPPGGSWPPRDRPPGNRMDLAVRRLPAARTPAPEPKPGPGFGLAPIVVVLLGLVGVWALATGQLETYVGMVIGVEPTPTIVSPTRPEPTVASIVTDPTATVLAAAAQAPIVSPAAQPATTSAAAEPSPAVETAPNAGPSPPPELPLAPVAESPAPLPGPEQQLQAALKQLDGGDHASAVPALEALREAAPGTDGLDEALYRAYLGLGRQQLDQGLLDDSYVSYSAALKLRTDDPAALDGQKQVVLAKLWNTMEGAWDHDEAVASAALEEILVLDPGYRDANVKLYALLVTRANRLLGEGDVDGALVVLRRAHEVYPEGEEAPSLIAAHTAPPTSEPAPAPAQQQAPAPAPKPAAKPASKPAPPSQKPSLPSLPGLPGLPSLPRP